MLQAQGWGFESPLLHVTLGRLAKESGSTRDGSPEPTTQEPVIARMRPVAAYLDPGGSAEWLGLLVPVDHFPKSPYRRRVLTRSKALKFCLVEHHPVKV